ncbi:two-component system QseEF-associated lipoprotein QseG [Ewingella sp. S1.OA.A_B6]
MATVNPVLLPFAAALRRAALALIAVPALLMGCTPHSTSDGYYRPIEDMIPTSKVIDFRVAPCETLWALDDGETMTNSLYWLRAMDCADRMSDTQARFQAQQIKASRWDSVFKQSILISGTDPDQQQRRALLTRVNQYRAQMPGAIRPLVQLWRERQTLQVTLGDEKSRNARQQEVAESKVVLMTQQQAALQASLADTQLKLKNLTEIERQLSSRKQMQSDLPDSDSTTAPQVKPEETYKTPAREKKTP